MITIIGVLIALLLPAVQAAREAARRTQCTNQLKQLALAAINHEAAHHFFPAGGWGASWTGDPRYGFDWKQPGGWLYNSLPYLESQSLHDLTDQTQLRASPVAALNCPSRRSAEKLVSGLAQTDYAGNGGEFYGSYSDNGTMDGPDSAGSPSDVVAGGQAAWSSAASNGIFYGASQTTVADVTDGTSNTYLCAEKFLDPANYGTGAGRGDNQHLYTGCQDDIVRWVGPLPNSTVGYVYAPQQDKDGQSTVSVGGEDTYPFFGSAHSSGFNAAMCDGSVKSIAYSIDQITHHCLGNRRDGQPIDGNKM